MRLIITAFPYMSPVLMAPDPNMNINCVSAVYVTEDWWEGQALTVFSFLFCCFFGGNVKLQYQGPALCRLSVQRTVPSRPLVLINSPDSSGKEERFNRPAL